MLDTMDIILTIAIGLLFWKVLVLEREVESDSRFLYAVAKVVWMVIEGIKKPGGHR